MGPNPFLGLIYHWIGGFASATNFIPFRKIRRWWVETPDKACQRVVETYYGPQKLHEVLERSTWHIGQHTRQWNMLLGMAGIKADSPLGDSDFADLPMPANSPMSWLTYPLPGASLPPATEQPSVCAISATSILPIRPPHQNRDAIGAGIAIDHVVLRSFHFEHRLFQGHGFAAAIAVVDAKNLLAVRFGHWRR